MRFVSKQTGREYFVNERTGQSLNALPAGGVLAEADVSSTTTKMPQPEPEPEPEPELENSLDGSSMDLWDVDMGDGQPPATPLPDTPPASIATPPLQRQAEPTASLRRQKGTGDEHASSRKDLALDDVRSIIASTSHRTIEVTAGQDQLLLRALDATDCSEWARGLQSAAAVQVEWRDTES